MRMERINDTQEFCSRKIKTLVARSREFAVSTQGIYYYIERRKDWTFLHSICEIKSEMATKNIPLAFTNKNATSTCRTVTFANGVRQCKRKQLRS